jgi:hypothetical protein
VIDRIVDERTAVLLFEDRERELHVPVVLLPPGSGEGQWLRVRLEGGDYVDADMDHEKTQDVKARISKKRKLLLERMARRNRDQ